MVYYEGFKLTEQYLQRRFRREVYIKTIQRWQVKQREAGLSDQLPELGDLSQFSRKELVGFLKAEAAPFPEELSSEEHVNIMMGLLGDLMMGKMSFDGQRTLEKRVEKSLNPPRYTLVRKG